MDLAEQAAGIGALADPVRRALYEYVIAQPDPVGRDAAARAAGVPVHSAKFHLDRLVDEGLLEAEYRRPAGRSGPGAGRPAKLYRRSSRQFAVTLPERRYDLVGRILAVAFEKTADGVPQGDALREAAHAEGRELGERMPVTGDERERMRRALTTQGYEPRAEGDAIVLANCPFDSLAREHTEIVCALNHDYVQGVADGLGCTGLRSCLEPSESRCCVTVRPAQP